MKIFLSFLPHTVLVLLIDLTRWTVFFILMVLHSEQRKSNTS